MIANVLTTIQFFVLFISGLVIGPLFDKYGARRLSIPGTVIFSLALMLTKSGNQILSDTS